MGSDPCRSVSREREITVRLWSAALVGGQANTLVGIQWIPSGVFACVSAVLRL